tara:strand:+ start:33 stop:1055 length:1023 start_codon:yes stop_codon:yes gene_type:complete
MTYLITGVSGFIGFHLASSLLRKGEVVVGVDNLNSYYDPNLKKARLKELKKINENCTSKFIFELADISELKAIRDIFDQYKPKLIINLAAQAGVRNSIENPFNYIQSNIVGFCNILECCRHSDINHLVYASSSSVYGGNELFPFSESHSVDHPVSLYAATKKSNELMAHSYSHLYNIPCTGLRFFTVYGPWGRPDMALFKFTKSIINKEKIDIYNNGDMVRDFTYIDDIVEGIERILAKPPKEEINFNKKSPDPSCSWAKHRVFNIGNSNPTPLIKFIEALENELKVEAIKNYLPMQPGDVKATSADTAKLEEWTGFKPKTSIESGIKNFVDWYKNHYIA